MQKIVFALFVVLVAACGPPTAGTSCNTNEGSCDGTAAARFCLESTWTTIPCLGPKGCAVTGTQFSCDQALGVIGDRCFSTTSGTGACATDGRAQLSCTGGNFAKTADCVTCNITSTNQVDCRQPCGAGNCTGCCFNGACQTGNTAASCGKGAAACSVCGTGQVCKADQTCGIDPNSMWKVQPASATVRSTDSGGVAWDALGGAPDPYCDVYCPGTATTITSSTPFVSDTFTPTWTTGGCVMKASDLMNIGFKIGVYDDDVSADDTIATAGIIKATEAELVAGRIVGISNNTTLTTLSVALQRQ